MATLVLTAAGTALGGPIGGAIGAIIGQQADQIILKPKGRQGPRLGDLAVQTSSYGTPIPKLFGTMRVAGTVIWATDLVEHRDRSGGGKGRPKVTSYSYSTSFAVALSARPIRAVRRIWADGKLLRGAAGDFKTETGFRLWTGGEAAGADPLIASIEGADGTPAYRGMAYAVFEDFQLGDYGNRIPMLTFEIEADAGPVAITMIAGELSHGAITGAPGKRLGGYAAMGDSIRGAIETLAVAAPLSLVDRDGRLVLREGGDAEAMLPAAEMGAGSDGETMARRSRQMADARAVPEEIALGYYEPARDYQAGLHRARRGGQGRRAEQIELPASLSAAEAKTIAEAKLAAQWSGRLRRIAHLPWRRLDLSPGQIVRIEGEPGLWRVRETVLERMALRVELMRVRAEAAQEAAADPGRSRSESDLIHGPTSIHVFELPELGEGLATAPRIYVAAAGAEAGWRRAALSFSLDDGASWAEAGGTAAPAVMGTVIVPPAPGTVHMFDDRNAIEVTLLHGEMALADADDARLIAGANLAMIGTELIQFGRATALGSGRYRLSHLLRGRRGTEFAVANHEAGERFTLLEADTLLPIDLPISALGTEVRLLASGVGDAVAAAGEEIVAGLSVRPPAPVAVRGARLPNGDLHLRWTRRSRLGWRWADGVDAPLGEESERYRIAVLRDGVEVRTAEVGSAEYIYARTAEMIDRGGGNTLSLRVSQAGTLALSLPAYFYLEPLEGG